MLQRNRQGHYVASGEVNGVAVTFLLDTGASVTTIKRSSLQKFGIQTQTGQPIILNTAGGVVKSHLVTLNSLNIAGQIVNNIDVAVLDIPGIAGDGLLGVDYLNHFKFIIDQKRRTLFLTPK